VRTGTTYSAPAVSRRSVVDASLIGLPSSDLGAISAVFTPTPGSDDPTGPDGPTAASSPYSSPKVSNRVDVGPVLNGGAFSASGGLEG
jgi:hypothetical protein